MRTNIMENGLQALRPGKDIGRTVRKPVRPGSLYHPLYLQTFESIQEVLVSCKSSTRFGRDIGWSVSLRIAFHYINNGGSLLKSSLVSVNVVPYPNVIFMICLLGLIRALAFCLRKCRRGFETRNFRKQTNIQTGDVKINNGVCDQQIL